MTRYLLLILFIATMGSRALGLDLGLAPGISIKNLMLYAAASVIAVECAMAHNRKVELLPVILPFALLLIYALMTWVVTIIFLENPYYIPRTTLIRLKVKLVDQFLMMLVFFYGVINWKEALWLFKALVWVLIIGCLVTVVDTFNFPDLGIVTARDRDGRVEGIIGDSQDFGGLLGFALPAMIVIWWKEHGIRKTLALAGIGLALVSVLLSASRGAMVGIVAGAILGAFYLRQYISAQTLVRATMAALVLIAVAVLVVLSTEFRYLLETRVSTGLSTGNLETLSSGRTAIWSAAFREMTAHPLSFVTGLGWEAYYQTIGHRYATHSVYLDRLYNLGTIGLTLFVFSYVSAIAIARRALAGASEEAAAYLMASVIGMSSFMIAMAFSDMHGAALYVWAYMGLALRIAVESMQAQRDNSPRNRDTTTPMTRPTSFTPR
jgi:O-antigen ligase